MACLWVPKVSQAADKGGLSHIKRVSVVATGTEDELEMIGVGIDRVKTDVELSLRQNEIAVSDTLTAFMLQVNVTVIHVNEDPWPVSVYVAMAFYQPAILLHDAINWADLARKSGTLAEMPHFWRVPTWQQETLLVLGENKIGSIREEVADMTDAFVNDYIAAHAGGEKQ